jgi:hypothetical protein
LKNGMLSPFEEIEVEVRSALCKLQLGHAKARLLESLDPPKARGMMCSR